MGNAELADFIDGVGSEAAVKTRRGPGVPPSYAAPSGPAEQRLAEIWGLVLNIERIGIDDDFFELGGDSLAGAQIFAAIEQEFGSRLPLSSLVQGPTIRQLAALLARAGFASEDDVLVPLRAGGDRPPLFCIHELSGNVVVYRRLVAHLGEDQPVYGLQYPGQHLAELPRLGLADLASRYCDAIRGAQPSGPYYLAGFSLGGTIAYETALGLRAAGQEVALLALIDIAAPGHSPKGLARFAHHAGEFARRPPWTWPSYFMGRWHNRRTRQRRVMVVYENLAEAGLGARLEHLTTEILPQAWRVYAPGPYNGRTVLFRCTEDIALWRRAPDMGWNGLVAGGVETRDIPATHQYLMHEPAVAILAAELEACLQSAREMASSGCATNQPPFSLDQSQFSPIT